MNHCFEKRERIVFVSVFFHLSCYLINVHEDVIEHILQGMRYGYHWSIWFATWMDDAIHVQIQIIYLRILTFFIEVLVVFLHVQDELGVTST